MADPVVTIAATVEAVQALRGVWSASAVTDIDSDIDYFLAVACAARQVVSPYVVHIRRPDRPDMLVVARLENLPVRLKLAYWTFASVTLRAIVVTFGGVLGAQSPDDEALAMAQLRGQLDAGAADLILMRNVDPHGTLHAAAVDGVCRMRLAGAQPVDRVWTTFLPETLDAFLADRSAKSRSSFRREDRLLREAFADRLVLRRFRCPEEIDELCRDMELVSARTYQARLGAGFSNSGIDRALVALGLDNGSYRCWMHYVDGIPVAFWAGMAFGRAFYPTTPGFDPDYAKHSLGRYTMFRMIEDLCAERQVSRIEFGRGDAQYKAEYAVASATATDVWLAARRLRPVAAVGALSLAAVVNRLGQRVAGSLDRGRRFKTLWRRRLAGKPGKDPA